MVPLWSQLVARVRADRSLESLPDEIQQGKTEMLRLVRGTNIEAAYSYVESLPADVRFAVKPFFTHFTAGAAAWLVSMLINGFPLMVSAQVRLEGEFHDLHGVTAVPVILSPTGWSRTVAMDLADDEFTALAAAMI